MSFTVSTLTPNYQSEPKGEKNKDIYTKKVVKSSPDGKHIVIEYRYNDKPCYRVTHNILGKRFTPQACKTISKKGNDGNWKVIKKNSFNTLEEWKKDNEKDLKNFEKLKNKSLEIKA